MQATASWARRTVAEFLDAMVLFPLAIPAMLSARKGGRLPVWPKVLIKVAAYAYDVICHAGVGSTFGEHMVGVRVISARTGSRPSWSAAIIRVLVQRPPIPMTLPSSQVDR